MAKEETNIVHDIMVKTAPSGARLFKNVRGFFYTLDGVKMLLGAIKSADWGKVVAASKTLRQVKAGIQCAGSSDLWGFKPIVITAEMVGKTIAVFSAIEVKTATGAANEEQMQFINFVLKNGGFAGIARSSEDAKKILNISID